MTTRDVIVATQDSVLECAPVPRLTFVQGLVCGQLSFLIVSILFLKYFVFQDSAADGASLAHSTTSQTRRRKPKRPRKSSLSVEPVAPAILAALDYDIASHAPETLDWLNVLIAQALSGYRSAIITSTVGGEGGAKGLLEEMLNRKSKLEEQGAEQQKPGVISLDYIEVTDVAVGERYPVLSDARVRPSGEDGSVRVEIDVEYTDHVSLSVSTCLLANFPRPRFAVLPVSLGLTLERFSGTLTVELPPPSRRPHSSLRKAPSRDADEGVPSPSIHLSLHPDFTLDVSTSSLLGSRAKLQDVPKIEQLILARIRGYIQDRVVWPGRVQISLPAVHSSAHSHHSHHHHHHAHGQAGAVLSSRTDVRPTSDIDEWVAKSDSSPAFSPRSTAPTDVLESRRSSSTNTSVTPTSATPLSSSSATEPTVDLDAPGGPSVTLHPKVKPPTPSHNPASSPTKSGSQLLPSPSESVPGHYRPSPPLQDTLRRPFEPPPLSRGGGRGKWLDPVLVNGARGSTSAGSSSSRIGGGGVTAARLAEAARLHAGTESKTVDVGGMRYRYGGRSLAGVGVGVEVASSVGSRSRR
ncbi:ERMES complex subunit mmm1 [Microbotryomycetes sp. JL201]|nr:ERMES complex subunit mmm1 [Microbotryomycetes sp. JL201]